MLNMCTTPSEGSYPDQLILLQGAQGLDGGLHTAADAPSIRRGLEVPAPGDRRRRPLSVERPGDDPVPRERLEP